MHKRQAWLIRVQGGYRGLDLPPQNVYIGYDLGFQFFVRVHIYDYLSLTNTQYHIHIQYDKIQIVLLPIAAYITVN